MPLLMLEMAGAAVAVQLPDDEDVVDRARRQWARCLSPNQGRSDDTIPVVELGDGVDPGSVDAWAWERLAQEVTVAGIEQHAGRALMWHAGAVAADSGETVVLVAPSGTGKTTAVTHLGRRWGYLTDETVVVDIDGRNCGAPRPYPKPLSICRVGTAKEQAAPDDLGLRAAPAAPLRIAGIYLLQREPTAPGATERPAEVVAMPRSRFIAALAPHTSYLSELPRPLGAIAEVLDGASWGLLKYQDVAQLDAVISRDLGDPT